jgi:hypothetical protein
VKKNQQLQNAECDGSHWPLHFLCVYLGKNVVEVFTGSPLYFYEGEFFSDNQWVSSDGTFEGDGQFICSYKNNPEKIHYNLAFHKVRQGVENSCGRVGM